MKRSSRKTYDPYQGIRFYGGCVRYFNSTESLEGILSLVQGRSFCRMLACCGGGDQALTLLSALNQNGRLYAFDINPAQLFILAGKAVFLCERKKSPFYPSFKELHGLYKDRIYAYPKDLRKIDSLFDNIKKQICVMPLSFSKRFVFENESFFCSQKAPFWADDNGFVRRIKQNILKIRLLHSDVYFIDEWFQKEMFDLIYLSDISIFCSSGYYLERIKRVLGLLKPGGVVLGNIDSGQNFLGQGVSVIEILRKYQKAFKLELSGQKGSLLALKKKISR